MNVSLLSYRRFEFDFRHVCASTYFTYQEYVSFFRLYRRCVFDHTFTQKLQRDGQIEFESSSPDNSGIIDLGRLDENPFAGAPASQLVSIPSRE